jgi:hypothetical protein
MVASLPLIAVVGKAHGCTVAAIVAARTAAVGVGVADPQVGYTTYDTLEEHR